TSTISNTLSSISTTNLLSTSTSSNFTPSSASSSSLLSTKPTTFSSDGQSIFLVGTINVHVRNISNRNYLVGIVDLVKLDLIVVTETWFEYGTSSKIMNNAFGKEFNWFGSESKNQKSSSGSG